jgi:SAM-dependent methyltransferase
MNLSLLNPGYLSAICLTNGIQKLAGNLHGRILDVGCGTKPYQHFFQCDEYIGLDTKLSGHNHYNTVADFFYDGKTFPFDNETYHSAVCFQVFEHVSDIDGLVLEIKRVLKPGGQALISAPFFWGEHETPYDFRRWTSFGFTELFTRHGFEIVEYEKSGSLRSVIGSMLCDKIRENQKNITKLIAYPLYFLINMIAKMGARSIKKRDRTYYLDNIILIRKQQQTEVFNQPV